MKRGKKEPNQAACCNSGMRTIVSLKADEPSIFTRTCDRVFGMDAEALSPKSKF